MAVSPKIERLSIDDYVRLYEQDGAFELINGERKPKMPPVLVHAEFVMFLSYLIKRLCMEYGLGKVYSEAPYVLTYDSNWVKGSRVPDVMYFERTRWETYKKATSDWSSKPAILVPDFVIEVISKNDSFSDIQEKVQIYLEDGVHLIWLVDPKRSTVTVYENEPHKMYGVDDTLTGGDVLPQLSINLGELFSILDDDTEKSD